MRPALFAALLIAAAPAALVSAQAAGKVTADKTDAVKKPVKKSDKNNYVALALDEVHTLAFQTPVSTVYVGNPAIADVTLIDARHAFVQGQSYGRANVMVFNTHISVTGNDGGGTVTLTRGAQRVTLNCAGGRCEPTPMPGDGK